MNIYRFALPLFLLIIIGLTFSACAPQITPYSTKNFSNQPDGSVQVVCKSGDMAEEYLQDFLNNANNFLCFPPGTRPTQAYVPFSPFGDPTCFPGDTKTEGVDSTGHVIVYCLPSGVTPPLPTITPTASLGKAPQLPGSASGLASNSPNPGSLIPPVCNPPAPSISQVSFYCANPATGLGGATFNYQPSLSDINHTSNNVTCNWNKDPVSCVGTQNTQFQELVCTSCVAPNAPQSYGTFVCSTGYEKNSNGNCVAADPAQEYSPCPTGSHYKNETQNCVDNTTGNPVSVCPAGYPYYIPDQHYCLANAYPEVFDCQSVSISLGACAVVKKVPGSCQPPAGGCKNPLTGGPGTWDQATCSCK